MAVNRLSTLLVEPPVASHRISRRSRRFRDGVWTRGWCGFLGAAVDLDMPGDGYALIQKLHDANNRPAAGADPSFTIGDSFDTTANPGAKDGLTFNGNVNIGAYSVVILSQ